MKNKIIILSVLVLLLTSGIISSQERQVKASVKIVPYDSLLQQILTQLKQIKDPSRLYTSVNQLKRLGSLYKDEWLPDYYIAYLDLKLSMMVSIEKKALLLDEAKQKIDYLQKADL